MEDNVENSRVLIGIKTVALAVEGSSVDLLFGNLTSRALYFFRGTVDHWSPPAEVRRGPSV